MNRTDEFAEPVRDTNRPRRTGRTDPDADTPPPAQQPAAPTPTGTGNAVATRGEETRGDETLASKLASKQAAEQAETGQNGGQVDSPSLTVRQLLEMRRPRQRPYEDWVGDGTRMVSWIQDAVALTAAATGRNQQEVLRDALLGARRIPWEILDDAFRARFGDHADPAAAYANYYGEPRTGA